MSVNNLSTPTLDEIDIPEALRELLIAQGITSLFPPQAEAFLETGVLQGNSLVLAIPTASGKTLVAEMAAIKSILEGNGKVLYLAPLKALASEKFNDFKRFEELGIKVGLSTGDLDSADKWLARYDIIITTNEKADSLIRHHADWLNELSIIIADEIHLLDDLNRGPTLEIVLTRLRSLLPSVQIIALSATIPNAEDIAKWLDAELVRSDWRPTLLKEGVYQEGGIIYGSGEFQGIPTRSPDPIINLCLDTVRGGNQVLVFAISRKSAIATANRIAEKLPTYLSSADNQALNNLARQLSVTQNQLITRLASIVQGGAAFHHAGLANRERKLLEDAFRSNILKVICATPTLAAGVNLPARRVVIAGYMRYSGGQRSPIRVMEYKQQAGRAGRPKYDNEGEALLIARNNKEQMYLLDHYIHSDSESVQSRLAAEPVLRTHALALVAAKVAHSEDEVLTFFEKTLYGVQYEKEAIHTTLHRVFEFLRHEQFLEENNGLERATRIGIRTNQLYIDPLSAVRLRDGLQAMHTRGIENIGSLEILQVIASTTNMSTLYIGRDFDQIANFIDQNRDQFLMPPPDENTGEYEFFCREVKTARFLEAWIDEVSEDQIITRFGIGPGDIQRLTDSARWLLFSMRELAKILKIKVNQINLINDLELQVWHGCKQELLPLVKIPQIGRQRARILFRYGFKSPKHLREADPASIQKLPGFGPELVDIIKRFVESDKTPDSDNIPLNRDISEPTPEIVPVQRTLSEFLEKN